MRIGYFQGITLLLFVLAIFAFSDNFFWDIDQPSNSDPKFIVHGLFMTAWFLLLVIQASFIRTGNYRSHFRWGLVGMFIAIGVVVSMLYVFVVIFESWETIQPFVLANRFFMLSYAILVALAYVNRKKGSVHKRYLLLSTILIMEPIFGRVTEHLNIDAWVTFYILAWHALFISLFLFDWFSNRRIHPISWGGLLWFYAVWAFCLWS